MTQKTKRNLISFFLLFVLSFSLMSCQSKQDTENLKKDELDVSQTSSQPEEVSSSLNSSSPIQNYNKEIIENLENYGFGYSNRTLYGKEITYLGQSTTLSGNDQIYIQSKERIGIAEQDYEVSKRDTFSAQLTALTVQSDFSKWNQESPCKES